MKKPEFGEKLIEVRKAKGLTQEDVAEKCNITVRTIQRIESGKVKPRAFTVKIISETLGFDFFDNSNTGYDVVGKKNSELRIHTIFWYVKDLFNFKTNAMKKISILTSTTLIVILSLFTLSSMTSAQTPGKKNSITVLRNSDNSIKRIEVRFTNRLTYDSLVNIKKILETYDIFVNYKLMNFDDKNYLKEISCEARNKKMKHGGSLNMNVNVSELTEVPNDKRVPSFYYDYSKDAKSSFCIGACLED
jgi:transcriptional regulator with XRE-family HTH domain